LHLRAPEVSGSRAATTRPRFVVAFRLVATSKGERQRLRRRDNLQVRSRQLEGVVGRRRPLLLIGLGLVLGLALWMKLVGMEATARGGALRFDDPDTVRRLVRLRHLVDPATPYPYRDPADGWRADPARRGTVLHWTLPLDGVILALDPLFAPLHP